MDKRLKDYITDPRLIPDRRRAGVRYVAIGYNDTVVIELTADTEALCRTLARTWTENFPGDAACFCVQNGEIGGRPFDSFFAKNQW